MNKSRVITWVAVVAGFILVPLLALVVLLPIFIDSETVKPKVRVFVAEKTNGLARIEKIDLVWFPRPGVMIRDAAISFDTDIQGSVQLLRLYPSLLTGSLAISSVTADGATAAEHSLPAKIPPDIRTDAVSHIVKARSSQLRTRQDRGPKAWKEPSAALGAEMINLPVRILKVPLEALQIFTPVESGSEKN